MIILLSYAKIKDGELKTIFRLKTGLTNQNNQISSALYLCKEKRGCVYKQIAAIYTRFDYMIPNKDSSN